MSDKDSTFGTKGVVLTLAAVGGLTIYFLMTGDNDNQQPSGSVAPATTAEQQKAFTEGFGAAAVPETAPQTMAEREAAAEQRMIDLGVIDPPAPAVKTPTPAPAPVAAPAPAVKTPTPAPAPKKEKPKKVERKLSEFEPTCWGGMDAPAWVTDSTTGRDHDATVKGDTITISGIGKFQIDPTWGCNPQPAPAATASSPGGTTSAAVSTTTSTVAKAAPAPRTIDEFSAVCWGNDLAWVKEVSTQRDHDATDLGTSVDIVGVGNLPYDRTKWGCNLPKLGGVDPNAGGAAGTIGGAVQTASGIIKFTVCAASLGGTLDEFAAGSWTCQGSLGYYTCWKPSGRPRVSVDCN